MRKSLQLLFANALLCLLLCGCTQAADRGLPAVGIAFFAEHEGGLHMLDHATGEIRQIDVGLLNIGDLSYSKQRHLLAFEGARGHEQPHSLYLLDLKRNKKERIFQGLDHKEQLYRPSFDPSGQFLYAVNYFKGVYRYSLEKKDWTSVPVIGTSTLNPQGLSFSKSGDKVTISPGKFQGFLIGNVVNGTIVIKEHVLTGFNSCISPRWAGENTIIFAGRKVPGLQFLWKIDLTSKKVTQISQPPIGSRDFLALSNDEKTIVFTATPEELEWRLWQISADGSGLKQLTKGGDLSSHLSPVWIE